MSKKEKDGNFLFFKLKKNKKKKNSMEWNFPNLEPTYPNCFVTEGGLGYLVLGRKLYVIVRKQEH